MYIKIFFNFLFFVFNIVFISVFNKKKYETLFIMKQRYRKSYIRLQKVKIYFNIEDFNSRELLNSNAI